MRCIELNPKGDFSNWEADKLYELENECLTENIGKTLVLENDWVKLWSLVIQPKERLTFRRFKHPYVWQCARGGIAKSRLASGKIELLFIEAEDTAYKEPKMGKSIRDFENIGDETIEMNIIEFKTSTIETMIDQMA